MVLLEQFRSSPAAITAAVIVLVGGFMLVGERFAPLRRTIESRFRRIIRNLTLGAVSLAVMTLIQAPLLHPVASWIARERIGLLQAADWPRWIEVLIAIILLDYTLWWWHWANHRVPFFWRFHLVHHVDRDMDASTALRFHFGELALSILVRAMQMILIGVDPYSLWLWQTILFGAILFHHANLRLPMPMEQVLVRFVVTPRMHGIHHSNRFEETNSNWSSLLSIWDVLHRTFRFDVRQEDIVIGVPAYDDQREVTIGKMLLLPFRRQRDDWRLAADADAELPPRER